MSKVKVKGKPVERLHNIDYARHCVLKHIAFVDILMGEVIAKVMARQILDEEKEAFKEFIDFCLNGWRVGNVEMPPLKHIIIRIWDGILENSITFEEIFNTARVYRKKFMEFLKYKFLWRIDEARKLVGNLAAIEDHVV